MIQPFKAVSANLALCGVLVTGIGTHGSWAGDILGSQTYRPDVLGQIGVVAAGRHFAAEAGMRMLSRGGNAVDAGVAATFAAAVTEISHFGLGGEAPIALYLADRQEVVIINGQGPAPSAATTEYFRAAGKIPTNGAAAGAVPAAVDALSIALAEFGTLSLAEVLEPAISLADGFPWYAFLSNILEQELEHIRALPSGARAYLQGPGQSVPAVGSMFRQPQLAATLRSLAREEDTHLAEGRKAAIYAGRDRFYQGDIGRRIARAVQRAGGLLSAEDLARYRGRVEQPAKISFRTDHGTYRLHKTGFWGQGPVLLQTLALLQGFDLAAMGHNSVEYIHTVAEALKLALADRDAFYGDPDFVAVPASGLLSADYAAQRRLLIDAETANNQARPGDPWRFAQQLAHRVPPTSVPVIGEYPASGIVSPDTTSINTVDAAGNLFSTSPSSAWFYGGVFIAGDTGVPLGNRLQAFVLTDDEQHPNLIRANKRPRTTLSPTVILLNGKPYMAISTPGGDSQDQQILQVFLNIAVFGMRPQQAIEAPRFNSLHHQRSFGNHRFLPGVLLLENRIDGATIDTLKARGHEVKVVGAFKMPTATTLVGIDPEHGTLFGAADVRGQRFVMGW